MFTSLSRILKFAFQGFWRNIWLSIINITILVLTLFVINFLIGFNLDGKKLAEIEKQLKLDNDIMRFLITKHAPKTPEQIKKEQERLARQTGEKVETKKKERTEDRPKPKKEENVPAVETTEEKEAAHKAIEEKVKAKKIEAVDMDQLDKKLDEILDEEIKS